MNQEDNFNVDNDSINFFEVLDVLSSNKRTIIVTSFFFLLVFAIYSFFLPNIYKSEVIVRSSNFESSNNSNVSGLAALAGLSIGSFQQDENVNIAIETMRSLKFLEILDKKHNIIFDLMAVSGWDEKKDELIIDPSIYNNDKKKWTYDSKFSINGKPSIQEVHEKFNNNLEINKEPDTAFITISFSHYSPKLAKYYVDEIVKEVNEILRKDEIVRADNSMKYLKNEITGTKILEVRNAMGKIIEDQAKRSMFANVMKEYVLQTISPSYVSEYKDSPNRKLISLLGIFSGLLLSSFYILIKNFRRK